MMRAETSAADPATKRADAMSGSSSTTATTSSAHGVALVPTKVLSTTATMTVPSVVLAVPATPAYAALEERRAVREAFVVSKSEISIVRTAH